MSAGELEHVQVGQRMQRAVSGEGEGGGWDGGGELYFAGD